MRRLIQNINSASKARQYLVEEKFFECIELCNTQIELTPNDFYSFYYRAQCKVHLSLLKEALEDFKTALVNARGNVFPKLMLELEQEVEIRIANIYRRERKTEMALEHLDSVIKKHPKCAGAYVEKAGILSDIGDYEAALDIINLAIKYSPKDKNLEDFRSELIYYLSK